MAESFDPYHKWLGIPPAHQPPTHYRLLGVEQFEADRDVIDAAANQRMLYLQDLAGGQYIKESQKLLNEVAVARRCLLNAEAKANYDADLRSRLAPPKPAVPVATVVAPPIAKPVVPVAAPVVVPVAALAVVPIAAPIAQPVPLAVTPQPDLFTAIADSDVSHQAEAPVAAVVTPLRKYSAAGTAKQLQWVISGLAVVVFIVIAVVAGPSLFKPKEAKPGKVTVRWPLHERDGAKMLLDDEPKGIQKSESFSLTISAGKHHFVFKRRGWIDLEKPLTVKPGGQHRIDATLWWPAPKSDNAEVAADKDVKPKAKTKSKK